MDIHFRQINKSESFVKTSEELHKIYHASIWSSAHMNKQDIFQTAKAEKQCLHFHFGIILKFICNMT